MKICTSIHISSSLDNDCCSASQADLDILHSLPVTPILHHAPKIMQVHRKTPPVSSVKSGYAQLTQLLQLVEV
ncbi:hypothetical protein L195_g059710 [Trifolium pratense]|uniref:Uncharacterized protein n=1 Tax=Trifolium pratense TaxID=57577 RepID=A0A2K3JZR4_TRIPR|nr:hypothetical protein L195_g059710 [Trifolium pratense]